MKYGYRFMDWGLFEIDELIEVTDMQEDYVHVDAFGQRQFSKEEYFWVRCSKPIFLEAHKAGKGFSYTEKYEGPYLKEDVFDTREEAERYGRKNSSLNWY